MLRAYLSRTARAAIPRNYNVGSGRSACYQLRFKTVGPTSKPPLTPEQQARKGALEHNDDRQRDWDAKEIGYHELKPVTNNPTSVSVGYVNRVMS